MKAKLSMKEDAKGILPPEPVSSLPFLSLFLTKAPIKKKMLNISTNTVHLSFTLNSHD